MRLVMVMILGIWAKLAWAGEINLPSQPTDVQIFPDGAIVSRTLVSDLQAGGHSLVATALPSGIVPNSLRIESEGNLVMGAIESQIVNLAFPLNSREKAAIDKLNQLEDKLKLILAEKAALETRQQFFTALANSASDLNPEQWTKAALALEQGYAEAAQAILHKEPEIRRLEAEINKAKADLALVASGQSQSLALRIPLEAKTAGTAKFRLSYRIREASWYPAYNLQLNSQKSELNLVQQAVISQKSGEDWENINLSLANHSYQGKVGNPELSTWWVSLQSKDEMKPMPRAVMAAPAPMAMAAKAVDSAEVAIPILEESEFASEFRLNRRVSLYSGDEQKRLTLNEVRKNVELEIRATPSLDNKAYVYVAFNYKEGSHLLPGPASLYRDGILVGEYGLPLLRKGENVSLPFGRDDKIKVTRRLVGDKQSQYGVFVSENGERKVWEIELQNLHDKDLRLKIVERLPVSRDQRLEVEPLGFAKEPEATGSKIPGIISHSVNLGGGRSQTLLFGYELRWPEGMRPAGL